MSARGIECLAASFKLALRSLIDGAADPLANPFGVQCIRWSGGIAQLWPLQSRHPSKRAGKNSKARNIANIALTMMPISRNGRDKSQTIGNRTNASNAIGQHSTNKMHQLTKRISNFML